MFFLAIAHQPLRGLQYSHDTAHNPTGTLLNNVHPLYHIGGCKIGHPHATPHHPPHTHPMWHVQKNTSRKVLEVGNLKTASSPTNERLYPSSYNHL